MAIPEFKIREAGHALGVGVAVLITSEDHPGCILLSQRLKSDGAGTFALPGGHLAFGETFEACSIRETKEETGLDLRDCRVCATCNALDASQSYHYITIFTIGSVVGEPTNLEPEKHSDWQWVRWDDPEFPSNLFTALKIVREKGFNPFSAESPCFY
mmetsp:Transcript_5958/g.14179  ORF Transcript_5958/g.14179 Transcript_5958/m.14179 type:complete len:157 (+) Transcript_5958:29-499(+)